MMKKHRIFVVFGTRPEAIKLAPLILELKKRKGFQTQVVLTGQHRKMLDQVMEIFGLRAGYDLNIMREGQSLTDITKECLAGLEKIFRDDRPDFVLVQGDTTTAFTGALAAFYQKIPVGHVEAGLRTDDKFNPYPEEINRRLITSIADYHFAPTGWAAKNLLNENVPAGRIFVTGNTVIDALRIIVRRPLSSGFFRRFKKSHRLILVTAHRRENWGEPMRCICAALKKLVLTHYDIEIAFPVHLNPRVRSVVKKSGLIHPRIHLLPPLDYELFAGLMNRCYFVISDSGGVQEEAPALGKPVLVMRKTTERPEGIKAGTVRLVGCKTSNIVSWADRLLLEPRAYNKMANAVNPYGDGLASKRIADFLSRHFRISRHFPQPFKAR